MEGGSRRQAEFIQRQTRGGCVARQQVRSGQRCSHQQWHQDGAVLPGERLRGMV